jgi:hypothetical protein
VGTLVFLLQSNSCGARLCGGCGTRLLCCGYVFIPRPQRILSFPAKTLAQKKNCLLHMATRRQLATVPPTGGGFSGRTATNLRNGILGMLMWVTGIQRMHMWVIQGGGGGVGALVGWWRRQWCVGRSVVAAWRRVGALASAVHW